MPTTMTKPATPRLAPRPAIRAKRPRSPWRKRVLHLLRRGHLYLGMPLFPWAILYGALSDREDAVAERYGVHRRASRSKDEQRQHGTFIVDGEGTIVSANRGRHPFVDNKSLLFILALSQSSLPTPSSTSIASNGH